MKFTKISLLEQVKQAKTSRRFEGMPVLGRGKNIDIVGIVRKLLPNMELQPHTIKFLKSLKPDKWRLGGYGSGKTYDGAALAIALSYINAGLIGLVVIQTKGNTQRTSKQVLIDMCTENGLSWSSSSPDASYEEFVIHFGDGKRGIMWLISGYNAANLKGPTVAWGWMDEPFVQDEDTHDVFISRVRDPRAVLNMVFFTGTIEPEEMNWGFDIIDNDYHGDERTFKIVVPTWMNKFATKEFIERVSAKWSEEKKQVYIEGKNVDLNGKAVYNGFKYERNVRKLSEFSFRPGVRTLGIGIDFNVDNMSGAEFYFRGRVREQIDEYKLTGSNTEQLCRLILNRFDEKYPGIFKENKNEYVTYITMDPSAKARKTSAGLGITDAKIIKDIFYSSGMHCSIHVPQDIIPVRFSVNTVNKLLETEEYIIRDNCKDTIKDMKFVKWKKNADKFIIDKSGKDLTHSSDAARYLLWLSEMIVGSETAADDFAVYTREER